MSAQETNKRSAHDSMFDKENQTNIEWLMHDFSLMWFTYEMKESESQEKSRKLDLLTTKTCVPWSKRRTHVSCWLVINKSFPWCFLSLWTTLNTSLSTAVINDERQRLSFVLSRSAHHLQAVDNFFSNIRYNPMVRKKESGGCCKRRNEEPIGHSI